MIFERKNKQYGAYDLRMNYEARLIRAFLIGCLLAGMAILVPMVLRWVHPNTDRQGPLRLREGLVFVNPSVFVPPAAVLSVLPQTAAGKAPLSTPRDPLAFRPVAREPLPVDPAPAPAPGPAGLTPGTVTGNPVSGPVGAPTAAVTTIPTPAVYSQASVEVAPDFPGGLDAFYRYFRSKLRYTPQARMEGLSGRYFVQFVVGTDGQVRDVRFLKPIGYGMESEIEKVLAGGPRWSPGRYSGENVSTAMVLPVNFSLLAE
jgi:protein TonB